MSGHLNLEPGFHQNISPEDYHADRLCSRPTLSRSLAEVFLTKAPIHGFAAHPRLAPAAAGDVDDDATAAMDFGTLGHALLLGKGAEIEVGDWNDFKTNAAKDWRKTVRAAGKTAILRKTYDRGIALRDGALGWLDKLGLKTAFLEAQSEVVALFDDATVRCRVMYDKINLSTGQIYDIKITESANPKACERQIVNMSYDLQEVFYRKGVKHLLPMLAGREKFTFLFIENKYPFCVTPMELNGEFQTLGESKYGFAYAVWLLCNQNNQWPAYTDRVVRAAPPGWALNAEFGRDLPTFKEENPTTNPTT